MKKMIFPAIGYSLGLAFIIGICIFCSHEGKKQEAIIKSQAILANVLLNNDKVQLELFFQAGCLILPDEQLLDRMFYDWYYHRNPEMDDKEIKSLSRQKVTAVIDAIRCQTIKLPLIENPETKKEGESGQ